MHKAFVTSVRFSWYLVFLERITGTERTLHLWMKSILLTAGKGQSIPQNRALLSCFGFSWILKIVSSVFSIAELFLLYGFLFFFKVKSSKRNKRLKNLEQWSSTAFHKWLLNILAYIRTVQLCIIFQTSNNSQTSTWKAWSLFQFPKLISF